MSAIINIMQPCCAPAANPASGVSYNSESNTLTVGVGVNDDTTLRAPSATGENISGIDLKIMGGSSTGSEDGGRVALYSGTSGVPGTSQNNPVPAFLIEPTINNSLQPLKLPAFASGTSALELTTLPDGCVAFDPAFGLVVTSSGSWVPAVFP